MKPPNVLRAILNLSGNPGPCSFWIPDSNKCSNEEKCLAQVQCWKLDSRNFLIIAKAVASKNTYDPNKILNKEDHFTQYQLKVIKNFLTWMYETGKTFNSENYEQVFDEYKSISNSYFNQPLK